MVKVIAHRFAIFRRTFGREPLPSDPLFFMADTPRPIHARRQELKDQLTEAAEETNVSLSELQEFLGIEDEAHPTNPKLRVVK